MQKYITGRAIFIAGIIDLMSSRYHQKDLDFTVQNRYNTCGISVAHSENGAEYSFTFKRGKLSEDLDH